jgi:hypothetical protein
VAQRLRGQPTHRALHAGDVVWLVFVLWWEVAFAAQPKGGDGFTQLHHVHASSVGLAILKKGVRESHVYHNGWEELVRQAVRHDGEDGSSV